MSKKELKFILQQGEGLKIEFKESVGSIDKEIIAFANSNGGRIFLGVDDKGKVKGINITNRLKSQIQDIARNCDPSIKINLKEFENILIINIKEGKDKPYKCSQGFYLRQGANSQKMTRDEILDFAVGEGKIRFDEQINKNFRFPQDFDAEKFKKYLTKDKISKSLSDKEILINLSLGIVVNKKFRLNNAGILLFAKNPERFFRIIFYRPKTTPKTTPKTDDKILTFIGQDPKINKEEIAKQINITIDGVKYHIKNLRKKKVIEWKGSSKGGYWEIIRK